MAEFSEGEAEVEGEELEGEDIGQPVLPKAPVIQEPPPESDRKKATKGKRKKPPPPIRINLSACKYEVLRIVQRKLGWKEVGDDDDWEIYWTDTSVSIERIMKLTRIQKINHFSGMLEICRKRAMARNLMKMARAFPQHYDFFPKTFILPADREEFMADIRSRGKKQVYILKPDAGCQGRGIRLVQGGKEEVVAKVLGEMATPNVVAQHYLTQPLLIHGYKFDLRIYALVLSCDPLRVFLFHEGLARICTEKYSPPKASNLDVSFMHLTNYAVNKKNEAFVAAVAANADAGEDASKWCLAQLRAYLTSLGHNYDKVWADIADLIIKSLCSVQPILRNNYRSVLPPDNDGFSCFEILGYDIMLDDSLRPWLIEVNHSPSFNIDSPLDLSIKEELITQTIELVRVDPKLIAKTKKAEKRAATSRLLEPMHIKKQQAAAAAARQGAGAAAGSASGQQQADGKGDGEEGGGGGGGGGGAAGLAGFKPRTPEEYEAWRAKVLAARERYEAKHMGNFTRIFPSPDPAKQALYEELLKGAAEIYQASFQARSKRLDAADEKKRKEDAESDAQKAERLKAKAHRDKLAQMAVERRKVKLLQQQQAQGGAPLLPAYLTPPPPYLPPAAAGAAGVGAGGLAQQVLSGGTANPLYYVPMLPQGPYQYDPSVYQQYYIQQAYLYGGAVGASGGQRLSEVYGERSDGGPSASSSRPVSALSNGSGGGGGGGVALELAVAGQQQLPPPQPPMRIYSGPLSRAVGAGSSGSGQRPGSSAAASASGRNSPMSQHPAAGGGQLQQLQQQLLQAQLQQQGALPLHPFLGPPRRPSSATSRGAGAGAEVGLEWASVELAAGRGGGAGRTASPSGFAAGAAAGGGGSTVVRGVAGVGGGSHSFSYGHAGAIASAGVLQQLPGEQLPGAALGPSQQQQHQSLRPVSVGSAHNHVRHAHSGAVLEAAGAMYPGLAAYQDLGAGERDQPGGSGPGSGSAGPGRGLFINGSRPPSASAGPASIRDKLQPGGTPALSITGGGVARKQSLNSALGAANSVAAGATWDAAMVAAAAAAGQDPAAFLQYFGAVRSRPESAGNRLRPTSAAGVQRSPSPLGALPGSSAAGGTAGQLSGLSPTAAAGAASPGISRTGSGGKYGAGDMYALGLTQSMMQQAQAQQALAVTSVGIGGGGGGGGGLLPGSPKVSGAGNNATPFSSPRLPSGTGAGGMGPWDGGNSPGTAAATGRVYKQSRASGVASYPILTARSTSSGANGPMQMAGGGGGGGGGGGSSQPAAIVTPSAYYQQQLVSGGAGVRQGEDEQVYDDEDDDNDDAPAFSYQPLTIPDASASDRIYATGNPASGSGGGGVGGRQWSAAAGSATAVAQSRQRSMTGVGGVYVSPVSAPVVIAPSSSANGAGSASTTAGLVVGSPGSFTSRPPVYPPSGGGPGLRPSGTATSGRAAASAAAAGGGAAVGGAAARLNAGGLAPNGVTPGLVAGGGGGGLAGGHSGLSIAGSTITRGASGGAVGLGPLQNGIEGLQITSTGLEVDSQLRSAALAALSRKGLAVKGRKVAQQ